MLAGGVVRNPSTLFSGLDGSVDARRMELDVRSLDVTPFDPGEVPGWAPPASRACFICGLCPLPAPDMGGRFLSVGERIVAFGEPFARALDLRSGAAPLHVSFAPGVEPAMAMALVGLVGEVLGLP